MIFLLLDGKIQILKNLFQFRSNGMSLHKKEVRNKKSYFYDAKFEEVISLAKNNKDLMNMIYKKFKKFQKTDVERIFSSSLKNICQEINYSHKNQSLIKNFIKNILNKITLLNKIEILDYKENKKELLKIKKIISYD